MEMLFAKADTDSNSVLDRMEFMIHWGNIMNDIMS